MKIISSKEYKRLKDIEKKYDFIVGNTVTLYIGKNLQHYRMKKLMKLEKEELIRIITDINNITWQLKRKKESKGE